MTEYHQQVTEMRTASEETIGSEIIQQDMELERLEHLVVQVPKVNTHITHQETQLRATDAENRDTSVQGAQYQRYIATYAEHRTTAPGLAEDITAPTTAHLTAAAAQNTTPQPPHLKVRQTDCSHQQERARRYILQYQELLTTQIQQISQQL